MRSPYLGGFRGAHFVHAEVALVSAASRVVRKKTGPTAGGRCGLKRALQEGQLLLPIRSGALPLRELKSGYVS